MSNSTRPRNWIFGMQEGLAGVMLVLAIMLVAVFVPTGSARAQTLHTFTCAPDGANPTAGLVRDAKGNLYGTTFYGGVSDMGTVFKVDKTGNETVLYSFAGTADGALPQAGLVRDGKGNLYGTTIAGGASNGGTVFKLDKKGQETVLYSFVGAAGDGSEPFADLLRDAQGNLFGTTVHGGSNSNGTVFKLDTLGNETVLYTFAGSPDGANPIAGLVRDAKGTLYGTTISGGPYYAGTVFKVDTTGKETVLYSFTGGADGSYVSGRLVRDARGNLYGTALNGGLYGYGTVFRVDKKGNGTVLYSFTGGVDGAHPFGGLLRDKQGNLYGTTLYGGAGYYGTVFKVDTTGEETVLRNFYLDDGANPNGVLIGDKLGNLYGTTAYGGRHNCGTVFELTP